MLDENIETRKKILYHVLFCKSRLSKMASTKTNKIKKPLYCAPRVILTLQISNIMETSIFSSGWVVGIVCSATFLFWPFPAVLRKYHLHDAI